MIILARTRERVCTYYICEGHCSKGREGTFRKKCQVCDKYLALKGAKPARTDRRKEKRDKISKNEMRRY